MQLKITWKAAAFICCEALVHASDDAAREEARAELLRMAELLDQHVPQDRYGDAAAEAIGETMREHGLLDDDTRPSAG